MSLHRQPLLEVRDLAVTFATDSLCIQVVKGLSLDIFAGEVVGMVGESGSGKSVTVKAILGLLPDPPAAARLGSARFRGIDLLALSEKEYLPIRGRDIALIPQDSLGGFNPVTTIGSQIAEAITVHEPHVSRRSARMRAIDLMERVGIAKPEIRFAQFAHEYSGGMRQRAMIAMAIANSPTLIVADEPTTALDVTIQAQILDLLRVAKRETGAAVLLITHDLGIVADIADRVLVMYAGRIVEAAEATSLFERPLHPYSLGLLASLPRTDTKARNLFSIRGQAPDLARPPSGCSFQPRCDLSRGREACRSTRPELVDLQSPGHFVACHFAEEIDDEATRLAAIVGTEVRARDPMRERISE